uniref:Robl_LC7 domain-containing protein n=1 Tax=Parastrongyloides trichosuri TaxID=131310 RepID=A0A0N4Z9Q2_PARTI
MMTEVDEMFRKLVEQSGVTGVTVMDTQGRTIKSTLDDTKAATYSNLLQQLCEKTRIIVKEIDSTNDLNFMRIYTNNEEFLVAPQKDYTMIVIRDLDSHQTKRMEEPSRSSLVDDEGEVVENNDNKSSSLINVSTINDERKSKGWFFPLLSRKHNSPDHQQSSSSTKSLTKGGCNNNNTTPLSSPSGTHSPLGLFQKLNIFSKTSTINNQPLNTELTLDCDNNDKKENHEGINNEETSPKIEKWYDLTTTISPTSLQFTLSNDDHIITTITGEEQIYNNNKRLIIESKLLDQLVTEFRENKLKAFSQDNLEQLRFMHKQQLEISALHTRLSREEALNPLEDVESLDLQFDKLSSKLEELHKTMESFSPGYSVMLS